ncbi:MAG: NAD(P)-binding protein [Nocardia sp.]|nr:NAD(P)-binding protein [Nocardia sp.]
MIANPTAAERRAVVVGAGIAGLTAAIALQRRGWRVEILERASAAEPAGSGLVLWPNGLRGLDVIGLGAEVRKQSLAATEGGIRDPAGRWLARTDIAGLRDRYGDLVVIHRTRLAEILHAALTQGPRFGCTVESAEFTGHGVRVRHGRGVTEADLVLGADGINSTIRGTLWPRARPPVYAGYTVWRTVVTPPRPVRSGGETLGRGQRVGIAPLRDGRVYMFATANLPAGQRYPGAELAEIRGRFGTWHEPIPVLLDATDPTAILRHDIYELPPLPTFVRQRAALLGDAAHAMAPDLGQGANLAVEDAITLATHLDRLPDVPTALVEYDLIRRARVQPLARLAHRIGTALQLSWPAVAPVRNTVLRLAPDAAGLRALGSVLAWEPPA